MWNFSFAFPTLFILFIILGFYFSLPRLPIMRNHIFVQMIVVETVTIISNILSSYACNQYKILPHWLVVALNMIFFLAFYTRIMLMFDFTICVLKVDRKIPFALGQLIRLPYYISVLVTLASPFTGWIFYIDDTGYHSGPLYNILYVSGFWFVILMHGFVFCFRKNLSQRRERICMLFYSFSMFIGLLMRICLPRVLLMNTFALMALIMVYLAFENPEYDLDLKGVVFNDKALRKYIDENIGRVDHGCIGVAVRSYYEMRDIYGTEQLDAGLYMIGKYLRRQFPDEMVFYQRRGRFVILGKPEMKFDEAFHSIAERFQNPWKSVGVELFLDVGFAKIEISKDMESSDNILHAIASAFEKINDQSIDEPVVVSTEEILQIGRQTLVKRNLEEAIEEKAVEVFLQPLMDAKTGEMVGAEALSRIRDFEGNIIPPGIFIPIAEKSGRINEVGEQVFEKTCRFIRDYDITKMGVQWINVNLSPIQFLRLDLAERFSRIAKEYNVSPEMIHLEITEESMVDDNFLERQMQMMEEKGFRFVLDDYGTGYSNLSRLKKCSFINIKLDRSVVLDYHSKPDEILTTMIQAFKHMNFGITAEGIEDEEMAEEMKNIGCDYLQGYLYSKPIPMDEFVTRYMK